jgi:hypothetical protein
LQAKVREVTLRSVQKGRMQNSELRHIRCAFVQLFCASDELMIIAANER